MGPAPSGAPRTVAPVSRTRSSSLTSTEDLLGFLAVTEGEGLVADDLRPFVSLSGQKDDVTFPRVHERAPDGFVPVQDDRVTVKPGRKSCLDLLRDALGILPAGIVGRDIDKIAPVCG